MVKSRKSLTVINFLIALFLIFSFVAPISVYAATGAPFSSSDTWISAGSTNIGDLTGDKVKESFNTANKHLGADGYTNELVVKIKGTWYSLLRVESDVLKVNKTVWAEAKDSDVTKSMRKFVDSISDNVASPDAVQQLMGNLQDSDSSVSAVMLPLIFDSTKGDMYAAYKITSPFLNILSVVLGVGAVILILLLLFSTVMDLAYIGLPVWREAQSGKEGGKKHPFGVSYEALTTVTEIEKGLGGGDGGYRNAYLLYFRRRALTYIILAICIMYLIAGGLSGIIGFVLSLVSGITG